MNMKKIAAYLGGGAALALVAGVGGAEAAGRITSDQLATGAANHRVIADGGVRPSDLSAKILAKLNQQPITRVTDLSGAWQARASDTAGLHMTGDGIEFGPFADGGACSVDGQDYARLDYSGMNGQALSSLNNLVMTGRYSADNDTSGVGSPTVRVFFTGQDSDGTPNRLTFSPNTQKGSEGGTGNDTPYVTHEWIVTSGTVRYNDDSGSNPAGEKSWKTWVNQFPDAKITNINVLNGCEAGTNLTSLIRSFQINGQTYQFGSN